MTPTFSTPLSELCLSLAYWFHWNITGNQKCGNICVQFALMKRHSYIQHQLILRKHCCPKQNNKWKQKRSHCVRLDRNRECSFYSNFISFFTVVDGKVSVDLILTKKNSTIRLLNHMFNGTVMKSVLNKLWIIILKSSFEVELFSSWKIFPKDRRIETNHTTFKTWFQIWTTDS